jgi:hypothetical protein
MQPSLNLGGNLIALEHQLPSSLIRLDPDCGMLETEVEGPLVPFKFFPHVALKVLPFMVEKRGHLCIHPAWAALSGQVLSAFKRALVSALRSG